MKRKLVEFALDTSIFEVLLCHINNFSSFTLINLISLAIFLSFCLTVHNTYVQPRLWGYVFFAQMFVFFSHNFHFFLAKFSHDIFRENFEFSISRKFSHFSRANEMRKRSKMVAKNENFRETIFPFRWKPYIKLTCFNHSSLMIWYIV